MRRLKMTAIILTVIAAVMLCWYVVTNRVLKDQSGPVISMNSGRVEASVEDTEEAVMRGVTAEDATDGDVTDSILIESISAFTSDKHRVITYAAFDSDNHVTHATRNLVYTDYHSPRFSLESPLTFALNSSNLLSGVTAEDVLDGDITSEIQLVSKDEIDTSRKGTYEARLRVSNSVGDVSVIPVTIEIYDSSKLRQPQITLTDYCIYLPAGAEFDAASYLDTVEINGKLYTFVDGGEDRYHFEPVYYGEEEPEEDTFGRDYVVIDSEVDTQRTGTWTVTYSVTESEEDGGLTGTTRMYVVVTDEGQEVEE